jgi:pimeloyl-ACP methyl ester carboxylesterase
MNIEVQVRRTRRLLVAGTVLLVLGALGYLALLEAMPFGIVYAPNTDLTIDPAADPGPDQLAQLGVTRQLRVKVGGEKVGGEARPGPPTASLSCWLVDPKGRAPRGTVLVLHGIRDSKRSMLGLGQRLARQGYRAVLVDHRGHGRSSGRWLTFGVFESQDLVQLLDRLQRDGLLVQPLGAVGFSYGASVALQTAARDPRVLVVAAVSGFASIKALLRNYIGAQVPVLGWLLPEANVQRALRQAGELAGFDPERASPERAIRRTRAQVLLLHGAADRKIPPWHARTLHAAAKGHSQLRLLPGKDHDGTLADRRGTAARAIVGWLDRWMTSTTSQQAGPR